MLDVERWAELRREHFVGGVGIKELARRYGIDRNTVRRAVRSQDPPRYQRSPAASKLDPFKDEIHELLRRDPRLPGVRVRELIEPLGFVGGKTIVDDYLREVRPLFLRPRAFQRTCYRPGEVCQFDLWHTSSPVPVGHGQTRQGYVVVAALGYSRAGAGALVFSRQAGDVLWGMARCLWSLGGVPQLLVWDREGCLHAGEGHPTESYAGFCGQLRCGWLFCAPSDPQAKGVVERLQGYMETNFEPGRRFANHLDFQLQLDAWFEKANARTHKTLRCRPVDRLDEERAVMRALPACELDLDERLVVRVPADPHVRIDTNDYSVDPAMVGRRVEVRVSQREITAVCLDTGELACRHERSFAKHRTKAAERDAHVAELARRLASRIDDDVSSATLRRQDGTTIKGLALSKYRPTVDSQVLFPPVLPVVEVYLGSDGLIYEGSRRDWRRRLRVGSGRPPAVGQPGLLPALRASGLVRDEAPEKVSSVSPLDVVTCPQCHRRAQRARRCRHCGSDLPDRARP